MLRNYRVVQTEVQSTITRAGFFLPCYAKSCPARKWSPLLVLAAKNDLPTPLLKAINVSPLANLSMPDELWQTYKLLFKMHNYNKIYKLSTVSIMSLLLVRPAFHLVRLTGNIVILPSSRHFIRSCLIDSWLITPLRNFAKTFIVYKSGGKCNCEEPTILKFQIASGRPCASMWCCALLLVEQQSAFSHRRMGTLG